MQAPHWAMLGLAFDIVGAFLLAVEAIKIENLRRLRVKLLMPFHASVLPPSFETKSAPEDQAGSGNDTSQLNDIGRGNETSQMQNDHSDTGNHSAHLQRPVIVLKARYNVNSFRFRVVYFILHALAGMVLIIVINSLMSGLLVSVAFRAWGWALDLTLWLFIPMLFVLLYIVVSGLWLFGEIVHVSLIRISKTLIETLALIEHKTASGVVGIVGFLFLLAGFLLQMYANYLQP